MTKVSLSISMEAEAAERFRLRAASGSESLSSVVERFALAGEATLGDAPQVSPGQSRRRTGRRESLPARAKPSEERTDAAQETEASSPTTSEGIAVSEGKPDDGQENREPLALESQDPSRSDFTTPTTSGEEPALLADGEKPILPESDNRDPVSQDHLARSSDLPDVSSSATLAEKVYNCLTTEPEDLGLIAEHIGCSELDAGIVLDELIEGEQPVIYERRVGRTFCWLTA